jgi:nicotinamide riboside transporter PnuC
MSPVGGLGERMVRILRENWLFLLIIVGIVGVFLFFRTPASAVSSVAEVDAILQDGQPTLVEFYTNT